MPNSSEQNHANYAAIENNFFIIAIGVSAKELDALNQLFDYLSADYKATFIINVSNFGSDYSFSAASLAEHSSMPVYWAEAGMELQTNSIYLISDSHNLTVEGKTVCLKKFNSEQKYQAESNLPLNSLFNSVAHSYQERAIGIILSNLEHNDGVQGLTTIQAQGGIALIKEALNPVFQDIIESQIAENINNANLSVPELAQQIYQCLKKNWRVSRQKSVTIDTLNHHALKRITDILKEQEKLDFSYYQPQIISQRIDHRLVITKLSKADDYIKLLETNAEERDILCVDLLIKRTSFFYNAPAWLELENHILPQLIEQTQPHDELRFWVAACSTGQEAYSLAMLVHEAIQLANKPINVKIFATDIDCSALKIAATGIYPASIVEQISASRLNKYFSAKDNGWQISRILREMIIFAGHNLAYDPPFTRMNLVCCRNLLIYMQSDMQQKIIRDLHFALTHQGMLFLGEAESLGNLETEFLTINQQWKLYRKRRNLRLPLLSQSNFLATSTKLSTYLPITSVHHQESIRELTLKGILATDNAIVLTVDQNNQLLYVHGDAQHILQIPHGKITQEILQIVVPSLRLPLSTALHQVRTEQQPIAYRNLKLATDSLSQQVNLQVSSCLNEYGDELCIIRIVPETSSSEYFLIDQQEFESNRIAEQRIKELEQELKYTQENLQAIVEDLESKREEQQASNEDLKSTNEELRVVSAEYQLKIKELIELEHNLNNLLQSTEIGVIFLDSQLRIRQFTPAACEIVALRPTDLERPLAELYWKIDCPQLLDLLHQVLATEQSQALEVKLKQQENYFLMRINLYQTDKPADKGLVITFININETKQAQQTREQLEQTNLALEQRVTERTKTLAVFSDRLKQIHRLAVTQYQQVEDLFADYLQAGCQMFNLATGIVSKIEGSTYRIMAVVPPLKLEVGQEFACEDTYCSEVIKNMATVTFNHVGSVDSLQNHPAYLNLQLESFMGTPILVNGKLYGTLNFSDCTSRQRQFCQAETEIIELMARDIGNSIASVEMATAWKKSESQFRNTFEQTAVGIAYLSLDGQFIQVNQRFGNILGYDHAAIMQLTFPDITLAEDLNLDLQSTQQMLAGEIEHYSLEKRCIKHNNSIVWVNLTISLVQDSYGQPEYFIVVIEDISDRKQAELKLKESKIKLKQANQAKNNFIAHMSHELRTPLTSILGFSQLLQKDSLLPSQQLRYANIVHQSGEHLLTLINDILDFSKITASQLKLEYEDFSLITFLSQIVATLRIRAQEKGIKLSTIFSPALPVAVNGDINRLRQVLYNLIGNAIKFTDYGSVTFKVSCITEELLSEAENQANLKKIRFEVEDTGIGIPQEKQLDIFAPFVQLNSNIAKYKGTGLGLTISQNIIRLMSSQIQLESKVDQGSKFWFDLELSTVDSLPIICSSQFQWQQHRKLQTPHKILVVDDNEDNRLLIVGFLQSLGFIVEEANNGAIGIAVAKTFQPDAIVTDLVMPVMDGKEMVARINQESQFQNIPIIMITSNSQMMPDLSEINCAGFLAKPLNLERLLELLENHLSLDWLLHEVEMTQDVPSDFEIPPESEIMQLLEAVSFGDLQAVEEQVNALVALEIKYTSFAQEVRELSTSFQQNKLEHFLANFLNQ